MKSQFTPGPWVVSEYDSIVHNGLFTIADMIDKENWKANARLIASAPELLAALEAMTKAYVELVQSDYPSSWSPENDKEVISARAAIAKAKGQV